MRSATAVTPVVFGAAFLSTLGWSSAAHAQFAVGEWARTDAAGGGMTMTVASCCNGGYRLTYHVPVQGGQPQTLTVDLPMDGTEAPVLSGGHDRSQQTESHGGLVEEVVACETACYFKTG